MNDLNLKDSLKKSNADLPEVLLVLESKKSLPDEQALTYIQTQIDSSSSNRIGLNNQRQQQDNGQENQSQHKNQSQNTENQEKKKKTLNKNASVFNQTENTIQKENIMEFLKSPYQNQSYQKQNVQQNDKIQQNVAQIMVKGTSTKKQLKTTSNEFIQPNQWEIPQLFAVAEGIQKINQISQLKQIFTANKEMKKKEKKNKQLQISQENLTKFDQIFQQKKQTLHNQYQQQIEEKVIQKKLCKKQDNKKNKKILREQPKKKEEGEKLVDNIPKEIIKIIPELSVEEIFQKIQELKCNKTDQYQIKNINIQQLTQRDSRSNSKVPTSCYNKTQQQNYQSNYRQGVVQNLTRAQLDPVQKQLQEKLNQWTQHQMQSSKTDTNTKWKKEFKRNLNILVPDNFDKIKLIIFEFIQQSNEACQYVVNNIIDKAWNEQKYAATYAQLCQFLNSQQILSQKKNLSQKEMGSEKTIFKIMLIQEIQIAFDKQRDINQEKLNKQLQSQGYSEIEQKKIIRKRMLGNVYFIAELFIVKVIVKKIIEICTWSLLIRYYNQYIQYHEKQLKQQEASSQEYLDTIEAIYILYEKVGPIIWKQEIIDKNLKNKEASNQMIQEFMKSIININEKFIKNQVEEPNKSIYNSNVQVTCQQVFDILDFLNEKGKIDQRLKCLILNLKERKNNDWKQSFSQLQGPQKVNEIHNTFYKEKQEIQERAAQFQEKENLEKQKQSYYQFQKNKNYKQDNYQNIQKYTTKVYSEVKESSKQYSSENIYIPLITEKDNNEKDSQQKIETLENELQKLNEQLNKKKVLQQNYKDQETEENEEENTIPFSEQDYNNQLEILVQKYANKEFVSAFINTFWDGMKVDIEKRTKCFQQLIINDKLNSYVFASELNAILKRQDLPDTNLFFSGLAAIFCECKIRKKLQFDQINPQVNGDESEEDQQQLTLNVETIITEIIKYFRKKNIEYNFNIDQELMSILLKLTKKEEAANIKYKNIKKLIEDEEE